MNRHKLREIHDRRRTRRALQGRLFEGEVAKMLEKLKAEGKILSFVRHLPNSAEDHEGRDFSFTGLREGVQVKLSFGITISSRSWNWAKARYPNIPQFYWPIGTNPATMVKRILKLI